MKIWIVCPCFFDTDSFLKVRQESLGILGKLLPEAQIQYVLIDDTAGQDPAVSSIAQKDVLVVSPPYNLGHQGALVFALRGLGSQVAESDIVITMDSDGEDRPGDIQSLIEPLLKSMSNLHLVSIAVRTRRSESLAFKIFYLGFKAVFRLLTGTVIRNGNYAAYRGWLLKEVIFHPHFDQCYSSSFISLPMQIARVPLPRGSRYAGRSRMGFMGLFTHGIRMLMPFSERIATRGILVSAVSIILGVMLLAIEVLGGQVSLLSALPLLLGSWLLGVSVLLFATFSQNKARSLRGLSSLRRAT